MLKAAGESVEIETITTSGDKTNKPLLEEGGKGLFVKELEDALLAGEIDIAVHSMKDVPGTIPKGLSIAAAVRREDPRDVFISKKYAKFDDLPPGARIGTSSPRRSAQVRDLRPDLLILPIRGNVDTRLKKLQNDEYDAVLLAAAGLIRMEMASEITEYFEVEKMVPSVGQGILGIEIRDDHRDLMDRVRRVCNDPETETAMLAERSFLKTIGGDCRTPLAAYAEINGFRIKMLAYLASPEKKKALTAEGEADVSQACDLGAQLARNLIKELEKA
jgi:hydroxymethylbilane synthase